jgi:hypothetical protein
MKKWYANLALACGCSLAVVGALTAQVVEVQAQVQGKIQVIQVQQGQAQAVPAQVLPAQAVPAQIVQPGKMVRPFPGPGFGGQTSRLTPVDAIFVGRVVAFEPMDVEAEQADKGPKVKYRIAVVQISESIMGLKKDTKQVRVAFVVQGGANGPGVGAPPGVILPPNGGGGVQILPVMPPNGGPAIQPLPGRVRPPFGAQQVQLQMGQEGMFFVNKHHKEDFFLSPPYTQFVDRQNNNNFDNDVKGAKQVAKVMADPVKGLKSDSKEERYTAAAILIAKYRQPANPTGQPMKTEKIDADESKLILKALSEGNWDAKQTSTTVPAPFTLFYQIGVTNYNPGPVRTQEEAFKAMQKWLDENNGKFRIERLVVDPNAKAVQPPDIRPRPIPLPAPPINVQPGVIVPQPPQVDPLPALPPAKRN